MLRNGARVTFRKPEPVDLAALYEQKNDPEVKNLLGGFSRPQSHADLAEWLERHRVSNDEVLWSIVSEDSGKCLGHMGLYKIDAITRSAEFGIMIGDLAAWGRGIGREATAFALNHAFLRENLNRVSLTVLATNERAIRLYRGMGFVEEGRLRQAQFKEGEYVDVVAMGLLKSEYAHVP